ncbi:ABC transporter substrate-binding protein [Nonomuraea sp. NPDC050328]|uniref:ABC transporter substrate-binding protein n=1 Tax=Nonomuraea sp. NPDC050328 TaxID=3364361 RepID=UPI00379FD84C
MKLPLRILGMAVGGALLAACSGAPATEQGARKTVTVYWNNGHGYAAYQQVFDDFAKAHGVEVNLQKFAWPDLRTRLAADLAAGTVPDLVEEGWGGVKQFAVSGDVLSLQPFVDKDGAASGIPADWQPATVERNSHEGKLYGVQLHLTANLPVYNTDLLAAAGVTTFPTTWDELVEAAKKLTKDGQYGVALAPATDYATNWLLQNGVKYYDPQTKQVLAPADKAIEALQFLADLVHKHKVAPVPTATTDYTEPQKLFTAGRAAIIFTGPWDIKPIREAAPALKFAIAPALKHATQATYAAGASIFIPAKAKNPDLAWDLIKRLTALETERAATKEAAMLMPRKSWVRTPEVAADPVIKGFSAGLGYASDFSVDLRATGKAPELEEPFKKLYQSVLIQNVPAAEAYAEFQTAAKTVLGS